MLPLVPIAISLIPDLIKILAGDKAGAVADNVAKAVSEAAGTDDPKAAKEKLDADPAATDALRIKLAEIALEATKIQNSEEDSKRKDQLAQLQAQLQADDLKRKDQLAQLQAQLQAEDQKRKDELAKFQAEVKAELENTTGARAQQDALVKAASPLQWAPAAVSLVVTVFFAFTVCLLIFQETIDKNRDLLNICVGALVAGFTTVISFWLGSSQSSRSKDLTNLQIQATQAEQATKQMETSARQTTEIIKATTQEAQRNRPVATPATPVAKKDNFDQCLQLVLAAEGGFSNHPKDPGGATNLGITLETLSAWRKSKSPDAVTTVADVDKLTREEACEIYRTNYWNRLRCDDLPSGIDLLVFDFGVNAGPGTSATALQKVIGAEQDGSVGPLTIHAVGGVDRLKVIREFSTRRRELYRTFKNFDVFGAGWMNRTDSMEQAALRMAA
jgi:hypothetical protein